MTTRPLGTLTWAETTPGVPELLAEIRQASVDDAAVIPQSFFARLRDAGFGRLRIPVEEGGLGGDVVDLIDALVALAAADSNVAQSWRTHVLATERHVKTPPGDLRARWIGRIAAGAILGGGWTEADGSGDSEFTTRLVHTDGGLALTGRKFYSTGSRYADWLEYSAVDDAGDLVIAAIRADGPGVELRDDWTGFGQRATASGTTILDAAPVDEGDVAPFDSQHLGTAGWQQLTLLSVLVGIAEGARRNAADVVSLIDRAHGAAPLEVLEGYGRISALAATSRELLRGVGARTEAAHQAIVAGSVHAPTLAAEAENATFQAQAVIVDHAVEAGDRLMSLPAALGDRAEGERLRRSLRLDRFWRNARTVGAHNSVLHRLRAIADHELYDLERVGDPEARAEARRAHVAERAAADALEVIRIDPAVSAALAADRPALESVAAAFRGRRPVLFQFDDVGDRRFDAAVAIATWLHRFPTSWFAVAVEDLAGAGHPYNVARRVASLEQLSEGRTAWVWTRPVDDDVAQDHLRIAEQLWRSWPRETIAADAAAEHFAQTESIRRIGADGIHTVAGPLNVPSSPQHLPVIVAPDLDADDPRTHVDLVLRADAWALPRADADAPALARVRRVASVEELLRVAEELPVDAQARPRTLRDRLRLPAPALEELPGASARFPHGGTTEAS